MPSQDSGARPINPKPQTAEERCLGDVYSKIEQIVQRATSLLNNELNRPNLTLTINGRLVENNGTVAQGFANVTGLTQPQLSSQEREMRLRALISDKTEKLLLSPPAIVTDYTTYIQSFGVSIARNPGDPGFSPAEMKKQSEEHLRDRISEAIAEFTRQKFEQLAVSHILTPPPPPGPDLNPLLDIQQRLLDSQEATRAQQAEQNRLQQEQKADKTPDQISADKIRGEIGELLRPGKALTQKEIYEWIEKGLDLAKDKERLVEKLKHTGLINYSKRTTIDPETNQETTSYKIYPGDTKAGYFQGLRVGSFLAWGATIGLSALALAAAPAGAGGLAVALGAVGVINAVNAGFQRFLKWRHTNTFTNTWKEIQSELGTMDPKRAPALSGLMYLLVDKYSPIYLFPNRTSLFQLGQPSSTEAVLDHLKEAAFAALNNVAGTTEGYYKGVDVREKLSLAKTGLENLEKRWGWHWSASTWWASTITTTSFLGFLGYGASAFL